MAGTLVEVETDLEEIVVDSISPNKPLIKTSRPGTPSGFFQDRPFEQRLEIQQGGSISRDPKETTGIAFSGGGVRSAAFCSGALRRMLQDDVPLEYLSCVSGGGYTGAAFLDYKQRNTKTRTPVKEWQEEFFEKMRRNAGYMCNWQSPVQGICQSFIFTLLLIFVVFILPCVLWLPYAFPVAVFVDVFFGGILRENSTCPPSVSVSAKTSFLILELYDDCQAPGRRVILFLTTFVAWICFFILSRIKYKHLINYRNLFRFLSILSGLVFAFTFIPWVSHDFLWPLRTWIKVLLFVVFLVLPFLFPIVRNVAAIFLFFYFYTLLVSWRVFKGDLFGLLPYSDEVFYPILIGCAVAIILFPFIGSVHQSAFNIFYRYRLSYAFFSEKAAKCQWQDVFPNCVRSAEEEVIEYMKKRGVVRVRDTDELTLDDLKETLPIFISNITVNDWQISSDAKSSHQLIAFSSKGVKLIGSEWEKATKLSECFTPEYMRLSAAMAISGAAVSYDMGSYESRLDMVLDLLNLLGIGMGDEMVSDQCNCQTKVQSTSGKIKQYVVPFLVEICCLLPLLALPFVYWVGHSKHWVEYLVLVHTAVVVFLTGLAMAETGSTEPGRWQRFLSWWIRRNFFVRFIRGFLSINNVGTHPPPILRLSDGGHFENLALLPLLDKKLKKIVIFDGSCNPGAEKYAESLITALTLAREKLHCSFEGLSGRDINEDIRVEFLKMKSKQRPRSYRFKVQYYDSADNKLSQGEILYVAPRHPSESIPLEREETEQPKPWTSFGVELDDGDHKKWGKSPELTVEEADRLTFCCCHCCHYYGSSHCISDCLLGKFPHHKTANQFFTPDTFSAYHREGYAACVEANVEKFLKGQSTQDSQ